VLIFSAVFVFSFYGDIVMDPSDYMFNAKGDGIKNYYTSSWYLDHNESWVEFEGMNHPNKELFIYTDGHPALTTVMRILGVSGVQAVGVINFLIMFSLFLAPLFIRRCLRMLGSPHVTSVVAAIAITVLAPQIDRFPGHYSLSYVLAIPMAIWMFLNFIRSSRKWLWTLLILGASTWWFFTHPYLGLMVSMFLILAHLSMWVVKRDRVSWISKLSHFVVQGMGAVVLVNAFVALIDTKTDRPGEPWGFWEFHGTIKSVFMPKQGPIFNLIKEKAGLEHIAWETKSYVGLVIGFGLIFFLIHWFRKRRKLLSHFTVHPALLLIPGLLVLIFSFGFPFRWIPSLADVAPFIKNFRVLARFAWVFYFTAGIVVFAWLGIVLESKGRRAWIRILPVFFAGFMIWEAIPMNQSVARKITASPNLFKESSLSADQSRLLEAARTSGCNSILPLPYFHIGSERYRRMGDKPFSGEAMALSFHSGLPLLSTQLSRSSLSETKNHLEILAPGFYEKELKADLMEGEKTLIFSKPEMMMPEEDVILRQSMRIDEVAGRMLSAMDLGSFLERKPLWLPQDYCLLPDDEKDNDITWKSGERILITEHAQNVLSWRGQPNGLYRMSLWFWNPDNILAEANLLITQEIDGEEEWIVQRSLDDSYVFDGDSTLFKFPLELIFDEPQAQYRLYVKIPKRNVGKLSVNHILLRPTNSQVVRFNGIRASLNNHAFSEFVFEDESQ
jgi:hypothetical protein